MAKIVLENNTNLEFIDISSEEWRAYEWAEEEIIINKPQWLAITDSGHRILDGDGISHYIPKGWLHLSWEGNPHFVR